MKQLPSISIVTPTWNSPTPLFERVLKELKNQSYPKNLIEHIVMDAGSDNGTAELAMRYGCNVTIRKDLRIQEQVRASLGIKKAKHDLILMLQSDNIVTSKNWLMEMVRPFLEDKRIFCTFSAYNSYEKNMSIMTRYHALFGTADPALYYSNRSDKIPLTQKKYNKGKILDEKEGYWVVQFNKDNLPTLGDNGCMFLRSVMEKVNIDPKKYIHVDAFAQMLDLGFDTCGVVKNSLIHVISQNIATYAKRRAEVKDKYFDKNRGSRKYLIFDWGSNKDRINVARYILYSLTIVIPLGTSIKGYLQIKDRAWFLHPLLCMVMLYAYVLSEVKWTIKNIKF